MGAIFQLFDTLIAQPLGFIFYYIYLFVGNYGVTIILFTILTRLALMPLAYKQQISMQKNAETQKKIKPLLEAAQKKYKNDKQKYNEEVMNIYKDHDVNPAGGCLVLLLQLPIMWGLYQIIGNPLTYIMRLSTEVIEQLRTAMVTICGSLNVTLDENLIKTSQAYLSQLIATVSKVDYNSLVPYLGEGYKAIDMNFLGLNLAQNPSFTSITIIIPILSVITSFLSSKLTTSLTTPDPQAAQMNKTMLYIMPAFSGYFCLSLPTGLGIYWILSNLIQFAQQYVFMKFLSPKKDI